MNGIAPLVREDMVVDHLPMEELEVQPGLFKVLLSLVVLAAAVVVVIVAAAVEDTLAAEVVPIAALGHKMVAVAVHIIRAQTKLKL